MGCGNLEEPKSYLAKVNDAYFTFEDLERKVTNLSYSGQVGDAMIQQFVESWITEEVLYLSALKQPKKTIQPVKTRFQELQRVLLGEWMLEQRTRRGFDVSDDLVYNYYNQNLEQFMWSDFVVFVDIYRCDSSESIEIAKILKQEKPLSTLLRNRCYFKSDWIAKNAVQSPFHQSLFPRNENKTTIGPIKHSGYFWVAKIIEKMQPNDIKPFDFVKNDIYQQILIQKKKDLDVRVIDSLKTNFKIYIPRRYQ